MEFVQVGLRVVRGPDWEWGDQDGGEGHVGTVVEVGEPSITDGGRAVVVQWDCGERCKYRCGLEGKHDLRVLDSAPTGHHFGPYSICHGCMEEDIRGFGWKCTRCIHYTLCSYCYFSGKHLLDHRFARYDTDNLRSLFPPRSESISVMAKGLFPGARVRMGGDWQFKGASGGDKTAVGEILNSDSKSFKGTVSVKWEATGDISECRVGGTDGKVDIFCVAPASGGYYYPDHLPLFGAPNSQPKDDEITSGDHIQIQLDVEILKIMQNEEHGGWNDRMAMFVGRLGRVDHLNDQGNLVVCYHGEIKKWVLNPDAVVKVDVPFIGIDEVVRVLDDAEKVMSLQLSAGVEWKEETYDCLGKIGRMIGSDSSGVSSIMIDHKEYILSPLCVQEEPDELSDSSTKVKTDPDLVMKVHSLLAESNPAVLAHAAQIGDEHVIKEFLKTFPNEVNSKVDGKAPIHWAIQANKIDALKCLLENHADVNILDDFCQTPLHYCIVYSSFKTSDQVAQLLLNAGADPNMKGIDGSTPVLKAIAAKDIKTLKVLVNHPKTDINKEDDDGETPLHNAVLQQLETPVKLLLDAGADPTRLNQKMHTALHLACNVGNIGALNEILSHHPNCINLKDSENGCTPLHCAILRGNHGIVAYLLKQPSCDINAKTNINRTPLHGAVISGEARIIELLVGHGADLNVQDHEMATPLHILTHLTGVGLGPFGLGHFDLLGSNKAPDFLKGHLSLPGLNPLENIADLKISDKTPQILKIQEMLGRDVNSKAVVACFLIQEGASVQPRNILGQTPLEGCTDPVLATVIATFAEENAGRGTFYRSLCNCNINPPVTSSPKSRKLDPKESNQLPSITFNLRSHKAIVKSTPTEKRCELCDEEPISVKFLPCGHAVLCQLCAVRAVKCLECKKPVADKEDI